MFRKNVWKSSLFALGGLAVSFFVGLVPTAVADSRVGLHAPTGLMAATVTRDIDGDTMQVRIGPKTETVRMLLIDTPEQVDPKTPVEPYAREASAYAKRLLPVGKRVWLQEGHPGHTRDKYGRLLAYVWITSTDLYNRDVVDQGLARVAYVYAPNTDYLAQLEAAQNDAKWHHRGIWSIPGYVTSQGFNLDVAQKWLQAHSSSNRSSSGEDETSHGGFPVSSSSGGKNSSVGIGNAGFPPPSQTNSNASSPDWGSAVGPSTSVSPDPSTPVGRAPASDTAEGQSSITVISSDLNVQRGGYASVTIQTTPGALGTIEVDYKTGPSHASGLEPKTADSSGRITWEWRVGSSTTAGQWPVTIAVGGQSITLTLSVS
ncbi:nuclease (SNase domain protein) [Alicyclobacillus acidocaldarius subsp. acidocaldarius DSM 446]|uniref:Nuclease (SNase domain protein) n=1 Tax=Alicyclobacillus acidocaldarius subsp. acidocaldarius (strain ATCC 27009 / DSM 446 / BCRC 14685 / JCM 5260 / KCTC 1825 / NBRC 15652 / NCIMB 11725 / NRRL B-14509 / 104-IA) TaxID=521098 RepID=C8WPX9_ALIAD|nr:nuclease (SNase domain protein) [Alicyclobacillus acidocaldarius subsp. acidocaldarius DSM 446]